MKSKLILALCLVVNMCSIDLNAQTVKQAAKPGNGFTIKGKLEGLENGTKLHLIRMMPPDNRISDTLTSVVSSNDTFIITGSLLPEDQGEAHFVLIDAQDKRYQKYGRNGVCILLHLESGVVSLSGSLKDFSPFGITIVGSTTHKDLMDFSWEVQRNYVDPFVNVLTPAVRKLYDHFSKKERMPGGEIVVRDDTTLAGQYTRFGIDTLVEAIRKEQFEHAFKWVKEHPNSLISPWILSAQCGFARDQWATVYNTFTDRVKNSFYGRELKKTLDLVSNLSISKVAPELKLKSASGEQLSLHAVAKQNKVTLVDFWAYWCGPCRQSFPKLKELYSRYHNKGFEIYGVSVDPDSENGNRRFKKTGYPG